MEDLSPSDLKSIMHSKRANLYYLQYCRVLVKGGRVEYVTDAGKQSLYWNIPIANTTTLLLGTGTSITQAAMRELAKAGVLVGFCGGGGTPLFSANEIDTDILWFSPQSEYRPTEYLQQWCSFWFEDNKRLEAAIAFQQYRLKNLREIWHKLSQQRDLDFPISTASLEAITQAFESKLKTRRGGLVFDVADLIKDSIVLPTAFMSAIRGDSEQEFRQSLIVLFQKYEVLDRMIDAIKNVAAEMSGPSV